MGWRLLGSCPAGAATAARARLLAARSTPCAPSLTPRCSHLIAKAVFSQPPPAAPAFFDPEGQPHDEDKPLQRVINESDYSAAQAMVEAGRYHRNFQFGRRHGHWVINGETW